MATTRGPQIPRVTVLCLPNVLRTRRRREGRGTDVSLEKAGTELGSRWRCGATGEYNDAFGNWRAIESGSFACSAADAARRACRWQQRRLNDCLNGG